MSNICAVRFFVTLFLRMTDLQVRCAPHKPPLCKGRCRTEFGGGVVFLLDDNPPVRCADSPLCTRGPRAEPCKLPRLPLAFPFRPRGLHITRPRLPARSRSFRHSSSPPTNRTSRCSVLGLPGAPPFISLVSACGEASLIPGVTEGNPRRGLVLCSASVPPAKSKI